MFSNNLNNHFFEHLRPFLLLFAQILNQRFNGSCAKHVAQSYNWRDSEGLALGVKDLQNMACWRFSAK